MEDALDTTLRFRFPSDFNESRGVRKRILSEIERQHYVPDAIFAITLALDEALINAIKHGNKLDPTKTVKVEATITPTQTEIIIEDEGPGFDRASIPDPTTEDNLHRLHGRGLMLIEAYMDEVEYSNGGRRLRMVRRNANGTCGGSCACPA